MQAIVWVAGEPPDPQSELSLPPVIPSQPGLSQAPPGQEGLVLLDGVQLIGGRVTPLAGQLPLGVLGAIAAGDVNVAAAQVPTALQAGATTATAGARCCVY